MAITERDRHNMVLAFEKSWGSEVAMTLAEHLPPVGWADVATRRDLDHLESSLRHQIDMVRAEMHTGLTEVRADIHQELRRQLWAIIIAFITTMLTFAGLLLAVVAISKP